MDPDRWKQIDDLFEAALRHQSSERKLFLDEVCRGDDELRQEIESLLSQAGKNDGILANPTRSLSAPDIEATVIGRYRLWQKIGEGGMGEVWLAEQTGPVRRRVALKLVKAGMNTREVIARFESERQTLALMDHPAIARVFDADSTPQGTPFFAMEYVAGIPITAYCDNHRLSTRERLDLFIHVCEGVQHAHHKAIIHRDLKPSNILVTEVDGRPAPKIIDFGVAKALTQRLTTEAVFTRVGALLGTPQYMSPEQALSSGEDIDTRTDVYSLGVILYELLAGAPPLDLQKIAFDEFLRRLRHDEPPKPSTKIRTHDPVTSTEVAHNRQTEPQILAKQIDGDLDSITLKALEKDRSRRYGSPAELSADLRRYLNNEPVLAVPPSAAYRARKFARRYRAALVTAAAFVLVLILATGISIWQSVRATRQRDRADAEAAKAQAVTDFLQKDLLAEASAATQAGPGAKPDPDLKVRTALDRAASRITGKFGRQPEVEAAIRDTVGQTYVDLGLYPQARVQLERALEIERRLLGPENPRTLKTTSRLGYTAYLQSKLAEAQALLSKTLEVQRRVLGSGHPDTLSVLSNLAVVYFQQGEYPQAEALDIQALDLRRRLSGPEHPDTLTSMNNLAIVYSAQGKYAQAEVLYNQALDIMRRVLGPEHPTTLSSMNNLSATYGAEGKYAEAEELHGQTLEIRRRVLGPEHPVTLSTMLNLATSYYYEGKYAQAEGLHSKTLEIERRILGSEHVQTLTSMNNLAAVYAAQGKYGQAEALFRETLEISRRVLGPEHPFTLDFVAESAFMYQREGNYILAETYAAQVLAARRRTLGSEHPDTIGSGNDLALAYLSQGKFAEAEHLAQEVLEFSRKKQPDNWQRFRAETLLGASLARQKKHAEAESFLLNGCRGLIDRKARIDVPDWYHLDRCREWIVQLYTAWGKPAKAAEWRKPTPAPRFASKSRPRK